MRQHDLLQLHRGEDGEAEKDRLSPDEAVKVILDAADRRARKVFFPLKAYLAVYVRPFFPDFVDTRMRRASKL